MKARIPQHREFIINFPDTVDNAKANEGWAKLQQIVEDYKKDHNGASVYAPSFIEHSMVRQCRARLPAPPRWSRWVRPLPMAAAVLSRSQATSALAGSKVTSAATSTGCDNSRPTTA